jgi:tol-pal system protein YbgF
VLGQEPARPLPGQASLTSPDAPARQRIAVLLLAVLPILGGCAGAAEVTGVATQQDLFQLRTELAQAQQNAQRAKAEVDALIAQLGSRGRDYTEGERHTTAAAQRLDGLASTLATLSARVDELSAQVDTLGRQLRVAATPGRPAQVPPAQAPPAPAPPSSTPPAGPPAALAAPGRPTTGALQPQDIYQAAYIDFSRGSYSLAIAGFREFLRRFPEHELAGNAQYWTGEGYLALARGHANAAQADKEAEALNQAVQEFKKVVANYPRADKVSTALYKEALALIELKQPQQAVARLQYLVDNFPQAEETPLAKERLAALKR